MHVDIAFFAILWVTFAMALTRKGSLYMRKKFDHDADAPNSESVWTPRFLFLNGNCFVLGGIVGTYVAWVIVYIELGMPVPLALMLSLLLVDVGLSRLMIKCFDWYHELNTVDNEPEENQEQTFFPF